MKGSEIIKKVAEHSGQTIGDTAEMFNAFVTIVGKALRDGDRVTISGFGTFLPSQRKARETVHPLDFTKRIKIPPFVLPRFKPSDQLTNKVRAK